MNLLTVYQRDIKLLPLDTGFIICVSLLMDMPQTPQRSPQNISKWSLLSWPVLHLNQTEERLKHWEFDPERICINNMGWSHTAALNKISISNLTNVVDGWMPV